MPQRMHTEVGIAFQPLPSTLTLTNAVPTATFVAAMHTSLEPGLSEPGSAVKAAVQTLSQ
eukprot:SAG31_NODE_28848_length_404_cov_1.019672_1_plen_59_part_10